MSRVGKQLIPFSDEVGINFKEGVLTISGPKGSLSRKIHSKITLDIGDHIISVKNVDSSKESVSLHGLTRTLIANMVKGVTEGFKKVLEMHGLGFRVDQKGDVLIFNLGYSHPVEYRLPQGVTASIEKMSKITLESCNKELLGTVAAKIRGFRRPDPYKGKGVRYLAETIKMKVGKGSKGQ